MSHKGTYAKGIMLAVVGMIIVSPDGLLMRLLDNPDAHWEAVFYRSLGMSSTLFLWLIFRHGRSLPRAFTSMGREGVISALIVGAGNILFTLSILHTTVANTLAMLAMMPLSAALLGWVLLKERVAVRTWIAIFTACSGVAVIFADSILSALSQNMLLGNVFGISLAVIYGLNLVVLRKKKNMDMTPSICAGAAISTLVGFFLFEPSTVSTHDVVLLGIIGFILAPIGLALFFAGTRYVSAAEVALIAVVESILGPVWAWIGVGEIPTTLAFVGLAMVIAAVVGNSWLGIMHNRRMARISRAEP